MSASIVTRKDFVAGIVLGTGAALGAGDAVASTGDPLRNVRDLDVWQRETDAIRPPVYLDYLNGRRPADGVPVLERLEASFAKISSEVESTVVTDTPVVWLVYNMGVIVKTSKSLFSIDLVHRHACEFAPKLDFALITHNHGDHYQHDFYSLMNKSGKTVVNNFIDNYGAADWRKGGDKWFESGGYTRQEKVFHIRDVEVRTSLTDHNNYLVNYTTAFEIRVGNWRMYHTGDCSNVAKLKPIWGNPDLWVVFPGCGIDIAAGAKNIRPRKMAFGHLWELAHDVGRLTTPMVKAAVKKVEDTVGMTPMVPLWGDRIS